MNDHKQMSAIHSTNSNSLEWSPLSNPRLPPLILSLHAMLRHLNLSIIHQYFLLPTPTRCHLRPPCPLRCYCHSQTNCLVWLALQTRLSSGCCHSQTIHNRLVTNRPQFLLASVSSFSKLYWISIGMLVILQHILVGVTNCRM